MRSLGYFIFNRFFSILPETRFFKLKSFWLRRFCGAKIGENVRICSSVKIQIGSVLTIGDNTWIGEFTKIVGGKAHINIGSNVDIGPDVLIVTGTHELWGVKDKAAGKSYSLPITIGSGSWLGARSTILGGVNIGDEAMIAANSLVNVDVDDMLLVGGVPCKKLKKKFE